jgi:DNA mismatch repair protein MutS2
MLLDMNNARLQLQQELAEASAIKKESAALKERLKKEKHDLKEDRKRLLREARQEAQNILRKAHRQVDSALKELKRTAQSASDDDLANLDRTRRGLQDKRRKLEQGTIAMVPAADQPARWEDLAVGKNIWVLPFQEAGEITALHPGKKRITARIGALEVELGMKQIALSAEEPAPAAPAPPRTTPVQPPREPLPSELNLIGMRVEPALQELEYYLEQAGLTATREIRIVHGFGTGRLRKGVAEYLRNHPLVASFHHPPQEQGGQAITIAVLK